MRRTPILIALLLALFISPRSAAETSRQLVDPTRIYITSFFDCPVFWGRRQIAVLRNGTRAQILQSATDWIQVRFWSRGKYIIGWIRR